jgi:hypothetical protein
MFYPWKFFICIVSISDGWIEDSINFMLQNFVEMIKLWVRMQYLGPSREREKRESERKDLEELIGKNLVRISQIDNLSLDIYERVNFNFASGDNNLYDGFIDDPPDSS